MLVQTERIVNLAANRVIKEELPQLISFGYPNNELIINMVVMQLGVLSFGIHRFRQPDRVVDQASLLEKLAVMVGIDPTGSMPFF